MFNTFRNRKGGVPLTAMLFSRIACKVRKRAEALAIWLQKESLKLSKRQLLWLLVFFCLASGGSSLWVVYSACRFRQLVITIAPIRTPVHILDSSQRRGKSEFDLRASTSINRFRIYIDSIQQNSPAGFDSIQKQRKGLVDSVMFLEQYLQKPINTNKNGK